ncbi:NAD(P)/FAD-dependent oxidoreductase [Neptunicoccus sediminis]|uniref:NAD(P)/FAD-dependent oxidoreductase n=1 Tax=Neptunicoccus sediminis TaxID=1892596 RepID=UPI000845EB11|nr:FAD-dependent oxidoreductase [Neptunicoccus sediminis]
MSQRIVIVGGGYLGVQLAKGLDSKADVTLIEPRSHFAHTPALIRAVVNPQLLDQALIPYDRLLQNGRVIRSRAIHISGDGVTLENGQEVPADYIVIATGSSNAVPFKPNSDSIDAFRTDNARVHDRLGAAQTIAIVGAGAVGTELAGEIAHFMPQKDVTLISDEATLFPSMPQKLAGGLAAKLSKAGVKTIFGVRVENLESTSEPYSGTLALSNGQQITADLIFPVIGSRPSTELSETLPGVVKGGGGRIKTDAWLRPSELPNVFAAGDVAETGDAMTVVGASRQAPWLEKTLVALMGGTAVENVPPYKPWDKAPFLVPLGPQKGNSYLILFTAGNVLTRAMKGKDLFLSKYNKMLGRG